MKKKFLLPLVVAMLGLASCGGKTPAPVSSEPAPASSSEPAPVSSSSEETTVSTASSRQHIDYAHDGTVQLKLDYTNRSFWTDGIEKVTLKTCIDGDTAHFNTSTGETMKARFYGIDTPESTGKVQPYGKAASNYTKSVLKNAESKGTIVISTAQEGYGKPKPDSTGSRYVSLIWVNETKKDAPLSELYLLNLMIVQDGYSWVKGVSDVPEYADTFYAAQEQAEYEKLNLFSGKDDPLFNYGAYQTVSLLDLKKEVVANMNDSSHKNAYDGENVTVQGTVAGFANHVIYLVDYFPAYDDKGEEIEGGGEYAGINIFTGMSAISSKYTTQGNYIQVSGVAADSENFGFQISGCTFNNIPMEETDAQLLIKADDNTEEHALKTFDYASADLSSACGKKDTEHLYCYVNVTDALTVTGGYDSDSSTVTLKFTGLKFQVYVTFVYTPSENKYWNSYENFVDKTFNVKGILSTHKTSSGYYQYQIILTSNADLTLVSE